MNPSRRPSDAGRKLLFALVLAAVLAGAVHPLRRSVESRRQDLLGLKESPARRLASALQFGLLTASGAPYRAVPGRPVAQLEDLPAQAMLTVLGGFRGPYAMYLWIQVEEEKQQKNYFDLIDRYYKIATLQPDYAQVWVFHMWNLAWNVSVQWHSLERKYQWVRRAVEFGEEGYRRNPRNAEIMASIGRIYLDKLGGSEEAPYYRKRVQEDEGRSVYLAAYEWYNRMRKANDLYHTLGGSISHEVMYSQACHAATDYATEQTLDAYDALNRIAARSPGPGLAASNESNGEGGQAPPTLAEGLAKLDEAGRSWDWAWREWQAHAIRWDKEDVAPALREVYTRFYNEARTAADSLHSFRADLTADSLPEYRAAGLTEDAYATLNQSMDRRLSGRTQSAHEAYLLAETRLGEAVTAWERALESSRAALERLTLEGGPDGRAARLALVAKRDAAFLAALKTLQSNLTYENLPRYYAARLVEEARSHFAASLAARKESREEASQRFFELGMRKLADAYQAWRRAEGQWLETLKQLRQGGAPPPLIEQYNAWLQESTQIAGALGDLGSRMSYETLPTLFDSLEPATLEWPMPPVSWPLRDLKL